MAVREEELMLGKIAIERGLISYDQLNGCIRQQEREVLEGDPNMTVGRKTQGRPLGVIMVAQGIITDAQLLELYEEKRKRIEALRQYKLIEKGELMLGQLLIKFNKATANQVNKCLEVQRKMAEQGVSPVPRIGEILVSHGFVDQETIKAVLQHQNKKIMFCVGCNMTYNVVGVEDGRQYKCRKCGAILMAKDYLDTLKADETALGPDVADASEKPPASSS